MTGDGEKRPQVLGSGLPLWAWIAVLVLSVVLFLVWDGLLWRAPREASHGGRFAVSYLVVPALAAGALFAFRRFSWTKLGTATGTIWAIKLIVAVPLYLAVARGTATRLDPAPVPASAVSPRAAGGSGATGYVAATADFASGRITGTVRAGAAPMAGAVVFVDAPPPGARNRAPRDADLVLKDGHYAAPIYVATAGDVLSVANFDAFLHTLHLRSGDRKLGNQPLRAAASSGAPERTSVRLPGPGVYDVGCDAHPDEATRLVVTDHPYVALSGADGAFALDGVPAGDSTIVLVPPAGALRSAVVRRAVHVDAKRTVDVILVAAEAHLARTEITKR